MIQSAPIKKKEPVMLIVIGIVLLIGALIAALVLVVLPAIFNLVMSFQVYTFSRGLANSTWVGLKNYQIALTNPTILRGIISSLTHGLFSALLLFASSLFTGYLLLAVGRIRWLRIGLSTLLLIPLFIPADILAQAFIRLRLYQGPADTGMSLLIAAFCTVRYIGLPAILVSTAISRGKRSWSVPLMAGGASSLLVFALLGLFDFAFVRMMPPMLNEILVLDQYNTLSIFSKGQLSQGAAASVLLAVLRGLLILLTAFPIGLMAKRLFPKDRQSDRGAIKDRLLALILPGGAALFAAVALAAMAIPGIQGGELALYGSLPIYIIIAFVAAGINTALCYCLARQVATTGKTGKAVMLCVLVVLTILTAGEGPISIGKYLLVRGIGALKTWYAILLSCIGVVWGVWPLVVAARAMGVHNNTDWFQRMWKPSLALFAVQAALLMNNSIASLMFQGKKNMIHPLILATQRMAQGGLMNPALLTMMTTALPILLLLIVRTAFREEESLGLFLPGR